MHLHVCLLLKELLRFGLSLEAERFKYASDADMLRKRFNHWIYGSGRNNPDFKEMFTPKSLSKAITLLYSYFSTVHDLILILILFSPSSRCCFGTMALLMPQFCSVVSGYVVENICIVRFL